MPTLPPMDLVLDALKTVVVPAAGAAALATGIVLALGRWAGALAAATGVAAGVAFANWQQGSQARLPWTPGERAGDWLPAAMAVLLGVGLVSRWLGLLLKRFVKWRAELVVVLAVWLPRAAAVLFVSGWVILAKQAEEEPMLRWAVAVAMLIAWLPSDALARNGAGVQVVSYWAAWVLAAGGVALYAHSGKLTDIATMVGLALAGVAVVGGVARIGEGASGAVPAGVAFLPGFLAAGRFATVSKVPVEAFFVAALAPLVLLPFAVPALARKNGWAVRIARFALILIPFAVALWLADRHETLPFDDNW